jgi:hypothetical protein
MNQLKLYVTQRYDLTWQCTDDNYDGAPDAGLQPDGTGINPFCAFMDYMLNWGNPNLDYIISGKDLI